jgi:hypothetical protein
MSNIGIVITLVNLVHNMYLGEKVFANTPANM